MQTRIAAGFLGVVLAAENCHAVANHSQSVVQAFNHLFHLFDMVGKRGCHGVEIIVDCIDCAAIFLVVPFGIHKAMVDPIDEGNGIIRELACWDGTH
jgi:hypothetical protein